MANKKRSLNHVSGCLLGGAVGDALGAPVAFMSLKEIQHRFGPAGISEYAIAYGRKGAITDDTQMTLFTAEGLILSQVRGGDLKAYQIPPFVYQAYLRWLSTQQAVHFEHLVRKYGSCAMVDGVLITNKELYSRRAPGNTCLSALMSGRMGAVEDPINESKGCGGVMRVAPVGYFVKPEAVFDTACEIAAITHGHPAGYLAAGCLAQMVSRISYGSDLITAIEETLDVLKTWPFHSECMEAITAAKQAWQNGPKSYRTVEKLGRGWIAEEALAIGLYAALAAEGEFNRGVHLAVNHGGDSNSTGLIAGQILGALLGAESIPDKYRMGLELFGLIEEISGDLHQRMPDRD
mgnify:CR=1 FL=1